MLLRYRHPTTANVEYHRGQAILAGKVRLEILSLGTRITRRQDPDAIGDFVIGTLLEPQHELLRVCSAHTLRQADPVAEPLLIHEIEVVLGGVRVLVLVDEHVLPQSPIPRQRLRRLAEQLHHEQQEVVEVHHAGLADALLVAGVDERGLLLPWPARVAQRILHAHHLVFQIRDPVRGRARRERALGQPALLHALLDERGAVVLVVDREVARQSDGLAVGSENPHARGVKRRDQRRPDAGRRQQGVHAAGHLAGGLVREGHGEHVAWMDAAHAEQMRDTVRDHPRLAAAGACQHEQRSVAREDGVALRRIEVVEEVVQPGGHAKLYRIEPRRHRRAGTPSRAAAATTQFAGMTHARPWHRPCHPRRPCAAPSACWSSTTTRSSRTSSSSSWDGVTRWRSSATPPWRWRRWSRRLPTRSCWTCGCPAWMG